MLPPLNLAESKSSYFARKRVDGRSTAASSNAASPLVRRQTVALVSEPSGVTQAACETRQATTPLAAHSTQAGSRAKSTTSSSTGRVPQSPRADAVDSMALTAMLPSNSNISHAAALEDISMIPREFFVLETHAVLPVTQYPPAQYHSSFVAHKSLWETVVFPALSPQTRQQVLLLRQTLEQMRRALHARSSNGNGDLQQLQHLDARMHVLAYTREEFRVYSLCFHELIRQIKCICKEQSELLSEIRAHYDNALARMIEQVHALHGVVDRQQQQISDLVLQHEQALRANDSLVEQTLRAQSAQQPTLATARVRQRRRRCACQRGDRSSNSSGSDRGGDDDDNDDADTDADDEELAWRRERRNCLQLENLQRARRRDSVVEENLAAARLQSAYHKYHVRKEQHRLAQRKEKHIAALEIQRSYRGFKQRQLVLHRRAVMQVILKRRKEMAAIELLQANVRSYLLKQKKDSKRAPRASRGGDESASASSLSANSACRTDEHSASSARGNHESGASLDVVAAKCELELLVAHLRAAGDPSATLAGFLEKFSELALAISELQPRAAQAEIKRSARSECISSGDSTDAKRASTEHHRSDSDVKASREDRVADADASDLGRLSVRTGSEIASMSIQMEEKIGQVEELATLFHTVVVSLRASLLQRSVHRAVDTIDADGHFQTHDESSDSSSKSSELKRASSEHDSTMMLCQSTSTSSLDLRFLPFDVFADTNEQDESSDGSSSSTSNIGGARQGANRGSVVLVSTPAAGACRQSSVASPACASVVAPLAALTRSNESDHDGGDFHLDESFWNAETSAIRLDEHRARQTRNEVLLRELLTSHKTKKQLVWLKQFMSDTYDTVVGRLRDVPPVALQQFMIARCALAMSLDERQRLSGVAHERRDPALAPLAFQLADIIRDHFQCQSGLTHLVKSAETHLASCLNSFRDVDPDVERFHAFLHLERSHDELLFYCVCRHLAAARSGSETGAAAMPTTAPSSSRQPVFHPNTMRELIELPHALRVARTLFRVDASDALRTADAGIVEIENAVYKRFEPSTAFDQFEAVLSAYYVDRDDCPQRWEQELGSSPPAESAAEALSRGRAPGSIVRPSNANQFHSKQFHAVAARSPLVRQRHQASQHAAGPSAAGIPATTTVASRLGSSRWLHFDDLVELLLRYRSEMHHFHLFTRWARELFAWTAAGALSTSTAAAHPSDVPARTPALLSEAQFVDTLAPYSLGPSERELTNLFHNALKQRSLQQWMPPRVFTSVVLLMLRNGLLSVSNFRPRGASDANAAGRGGGGASVSKKSSLSRGLSEEKRWMQLARQWRSREAAFERALEAIYESPAVAASGGDSAAATQLLELRNELFTLFISSAGAENLARAEELYALLTASLEAQTPATSRKVDLSRAYLPDDDGDDDDDDDDDGNGQDSRGVGDTQYAVLARRLAPGRQLSTRESHPEDLGDTCAWETDSTTA